MKLGIAGIDETRRVEQAMLGVSGEIKNKTRAGVGIAGVNGKKLVEAGLGVAGLDRTAKAAVAGNLNGRLLGDLANTTSFKVYDQTLSNISLKSNRLGDQAARTAWQHSVWFATFEYITKMTRTGIAWKKGREQVFSRQHRQMLLYLDSSGFRRVISGRAPKWAKQRENYYAAKELTDPDGYAWFDDPNNRQKTLAAGQEMIRLFPGDVQNGLQWPVFSIRWSWVNHGTLDFASLPAIWSKVSLDHLIPQTRTQKQNKPATRERWAREAIANALIMADDTDFRWMVKKFGRVMIGGMVQGPCNRTARHLFVATLCHLFPDTQFWLLGQANFAVVNGLGSLGLLNRVWVDGTWWIHASRCERFSVVENGLITEHSFENMAYSFFTIVELMAANLRSLMAAYEGLWEWPPPTPLPLDLMDEGQRIELRQRFVQAQMELGL